MWVLVIQGNSDRHLKYLLCYGELRYWVGSGSDCNSSHIIHLLLTMENDTVNAQASVTPQWLSTNEKQNCICLQKIKDFVAQKLYFKHWDAWSWEVKYQGKYGS